MKNDENTERFNKLSDELLRTIWRSSPVMATAIGIHEYDHTLGDFSAEAFESYARTFDTYVHALQSKIDPSLLDAERRLDYHVALSLAAGSFVTLECHRPWMNNPSIYVWSALWGCFLLLLREFAPLEDRAAAMLSRMREIPDMLETSKGNMTDPPLIFAQAAVEVIEGGLVFFRETIPGIAAGVPSLKTQLLKANELVISAFEEYERWLRETLLPRANGDFAVGYDTFEQLLFAEHYLTYGPNDIFLLGERVLSDTEDRIREVAGEIDSSVSWQELVTRLKRDHPDKNSVKAAYQKALQSARDFVVDHDLATIAPNERLEIRDTPEFQRSITPYAAYLPPPSFESDCKGYFWVTPIDESAPPERRKEQLLGSCIYGIPIVALHEAYPGHHLQLTRAKNVKSPLRRQMMSNLLVEGWALYCEEMMYEQGFYADPRAHLFQLKDLLWRACRVMIDVGLHTKGMTFDEAVRMLVDKAHLEETNAIAEVKRYTMSPTQPMTYVIGRILLLDLRERVKRTLKGKFDLKAFHDRLLDYGSIPPSLIMEEMVGVPARTLTGPTGVRANAA